MSYWFKKNGYAYCVSYDGVWFVLTFVCGLVALAIYGVVRMFGG